MKNYLFFFPFLIATFAQSYALFEPLLQTKIVSSDQDCYQASIKAYEKSVDGAIIGHIDFGINLINGYANIADLRVDQQFRRRGIAGALIRTALQQIQERCALTTTVTLQASPGSPDITFGQLIAFYEKCGAVCEGFDARNGIRFAKMRFKLG